MRSLFRKDQKDGTPFVNLRADGASPISTASSIGVTWNFLESESGHRMWNVQNPNVIVIPETGVYLIEGMAIFAANGTGVREAWVSPAGLPNVNRLSDFQNPAPNASIPTTMPISAAARFAAGAQLTMYVYQTSGAALNIVQPSLDVSQRLTIARIA